MFNIILGKDEIEKIFHPYLKDDEQIVILKDEYYHLNDYISKITLIHDDKVFLLKNKPLLAIDAYISNECFIKVFFNNEEDAFYFKLHCA